jgi:hypothetical protein
LLLELSFKTHLLDDMDCTAPCESRNAQDQESWMTRWPLLVHYICWAVSP